ANSHCSCVYLSPPVGKTGPGPAKDARVPQRTAKHFLPRRTRSGDGGTFPGPAYPEPAAILACPMNSPNIARFQNSGKADVPRRRGAAAAALPRGPTFPAGTVRIHRFALALRPLTPGPSPPRGEGSKKRRERIAARAVRPYLS